LIVLIKLTLNFFKTYICVSLIFLITLLITFFPKETYAADCANVNGATTTISTDCSGRLEVTGDGSNITIDSGVNVSGQTSNERFAIETTDGTNTTITVNGSIGARAASGGVERYSIYHHTGTGSITAINNNGTMGVYENGASSLGTVIWNKSTIGNINNAASGTMTSSGRNTIVNGAGGTITKIDNDGTIESDNKWTIKNITGHIGEIDNSGTIEAGANGTNISAQNAEAAIRNYGGTITTITNSGLISANEQTIQNSSGAVIDTINNTASGTIRAKGNDQQAIRVEHTGSIIRTITNAGTIEATRNDQHADRGTIRVTNGGEITTITNSGTISSLGAQTVGTIWVGDEAGTTIGTITNSGDITSKSKEGSINNHGTIGTINNSGNITNTSSDAESAGIRNADSGTITTITNTGTIAGTNVDIRNADTNGNTGTIITLNNDQGGSDALTYSHKLPTNYNVIINSTSDYGKIVFSNKSGTTTFGVNSTSTLTGSSVNTTYSDVISGLTESDLESCTSDTDCTTGNNFEGTNKYYWKLDDTNGDDDWDLIITAIESSTPPASVLPKTPTLESMNSLKSVTDANFAHMNTYDCDFFGNNNDSCLSLGTRRSEVTNPSSTTDGIVLVAGKKYSDHLRFGGFYHTNTNHNTSKNLKLSDKTPLLGSLIVWNQSRFGLGFQVKYANAYQEKKATITREAGENSEEGTGSTTTSAISNTIETRYILSKKRKINYIPYFAARHAIKTQDSFTEVGPTSPLTYNTIKDEAFTVLLGSRFDSNLTPILNLHGSLGIEHDIYHTIDKLKPTGMSGLPTVNLDANLKKTRPVVSLGFDYELSSNSRFSGVVQYQELAFESMTQTNTYFYYSIAF